MFLGSILICKLTIITKLVLQIWYFNFTHLENQDYTYGYDILSNRNFKIIN